VNTELRYDVVVVGSGNAGLCAAISAAQDGARVCLVEKAPAAERGGNSALTSGMRIICDNLDDLLALTSYPEGSPERDEVAQGFRPRTGDDYRVETLAVTDGKADPRMLDVLIRESYPTLRWLKELGNNWVLARLRLSDNLLKMDGGGQALQANNFEVARRLGVDFSYDTAAVDLVIGDDGAVRGVRVLDASGYSVVEGAAVVLAAGGFEASAEMRGRYLGKGWDTAAVRGVPYNTGDGLRMALAAGAATAGSWTTCHGALQDAARPDFGMPSSAVGGGTEWDRYLYPYGVMVDRNGERFVDEGSDIPSRTYARMGRVVLEQPGSIAYQIFDAKVRGAGFINDKYDRGSRASADTLEELAQILGIDPAGVVDTIERFNASIEHGHEELDVVDVPDGLGTVGLKPPKSNYARRIDAPPFEGFPVACGITFTFGGVAIDPETAQVQHTSGHPMAGLYAAGEMAGGLWHGNYAGGSGMAAGSVFGRIAGRSAATAALAAREMAR